MSSASVSMRGMAASLCRRVSSAAVTTPLANGMARNQLAAVATARVQQQTPLVSSNVRHFSVTPTTKSQDSDIAGFLKEEIAAEKSNAKKLVVPGQGFAVETEGAEVTFTKKVGDEKVVISMNVNHTVDSAEPDDGAQEAPEMRSKPNFEIDIVKPSGKTLSFSCSFIASETEEGGQEAMDDVFAIDEVTMFEGENWTEKKYAVAGDILDGHLYDLFMTMLEERGVNAEFVDQMSDYCSSYEHSLYINLLEDLNKFTSK